jgi:TPR repeat protein
MARFDATMDHDGGHATFAMTGQTLFELGLRYSAGRDVEIDMIAAHKWFNLAAARGHDGAKYYRSELASEMTRQQIAKAQRLAREWLRGS